ncbi:MAG: hypothetical protein L6Q37_02000 [Bdellovibrionaceae bacterium]|nr:hypothetical protein [Pseudobdellovibrionaceae bacterium]NUM60169.1 hypothetical protein [Pseudobdellovibrionaceae bacterium]
MLSEKIIFLSLLLISETILGITTWTVPPKIYNQNTGFSYLAFSSGCNSLNLAIDALPCNPAFIAKERRDRFAAHLFLGNNISYLKQVRDLSEGTASETTIRDLFQRHENEELQTQLEVGYLNETYGWAVTPFELKYLSSFQNQSLPKISLYASIEESAKVQFGSFIDNHWAYGVQLRYLQRRFVNSEFFLTESLTSDGDQILQTQKQNLFFIEPAMMYAPEAHSLNPEFSLFLANLALGDTNQSALPVIPQLHITSSINPVINHGRFGIGFDISLDKNLDKGYGPFTLASFYEFGILRLLGSLGRAENTIGATVFDSWWNVSLVYKTETYENALSEAYEQRKSYLFLGIDL